MKTMKLTVILMFLVCAMACARATSKAGKQWFVPEEIASKPLATGTKGLGNYLTPAQGKTMLELTLQHCPTAADWNARATFLRQNILKGAGLDPLPRRCQLNSIIRDRRVHDGYSVENVAFESIPGFYVTGNLYRPLGAKGRRPGIINTHGHGTLGVMDKAPRFSDTMAVRCAALARMGAVCFSIDMFGYGESMNQTDPKAHNTPLAMQMQLWDAMRAIDFLQSLPDVDPHQIGINGESGGGTQTFVLTAVDPRITISVPVAMVSSYFYGGCACESGREVQRSPEHFTTNCEIAALAAPRPMLVVSDGTDWTKLVPEQEFPFLKNIYSLCGAGQNVENVHLIKEKHGYSAPMRDAMYRFMARRLNLDLKVILDAQGNVDEKKNFTHEEPAAMKVFTTDNPLPAGALKGAEAIAAEFKEMQKK